MADVRRLRLGVFVGVILMIGAAAPLHASPADLFGLGGRWGGMGDAAVAGVTEPAAIFFNPAGLAAARSATVSVGLMGQGTWLSLPAGKMQRLDWPVDAVVGLSAPVPFEGWMAQRLWVGLLLVAAPSSLAVIRGRTATEVFYPYYDNRAQRLMVLPAIAFRAMDSSGRGRLTLGVSLDILADMSGLVLARESAARSVEARVSEELSTRVGVIAGIRYALGDWALGLAYRQAFFLRMTTDSFNHVAGADLDLSLSLDTLYDPHTFVLGGQWTPGPWTLALQVSYSLWRFYKGPFVATTSELPLVGALETDLPDIPFHDTVSVVAGTEYRFALPRTMTLSLRGGLGFDSSPLPLQHGRTNMLDGHKVSASLGLGLDLGRVVGRRIRLDAHARATVLIPRTMDKRLFMPDEQCPAPPPGTVDPDDYLLDERPCDRTDPDSLGFQTSNPGYPTLRSSGFVLSGGVSLEVEL